MLIGEDNGVSVNPLVYNEVDMEDRDLLVFKFLIYCGILYITSMTSKDKTWSKQQ